MGQPDEGSNILSQELLLGVAEELKIPLLQIARQAEQGRLSGTTDLERIQSSADGAVGLIDNYILGVRMAIQPEVFERESVSVSSVLYEASQQLAGLAKSYGVELDLSISGRYGPVMANRKGLQAALVSLGAALIEALPAQEGAQLKLHFATHRSRYGIVAGLYSDTKQISSDALNKGRKLQRQSRQPLNKLSHTSGAGIFVADAILQSMDLRLTASRHNNLYGLGAVMQPNHQLQLV